MTPAQRIPWHQGPTSEAIGLKPEGKRVYELADGSEISVDVAVAKIEFMGEFVGGTIIFGETGAGAAPGRHSARIRRYRSGSTVNQQLKRLPAVRLKGMA